MHTIIHSTVPILIALIGLFVAACEPLTPYPTPTQVVFIVTAEATSTPTATPSPVPSPTRAPTATPIATATATLIPCQAEGGQMIEVDDFRSEVANETLPYRVYLPPCYIETQKRYPVIILLHGLGETEAQWDELGIDDTLDEGIRDGSLPPAILVLPFMGNIGNDNSFPPDDSYETVVMDELLPAIQRDFCTIDDRNQRAIGGISRGGFWAYSLALKHPDVFGIVGGHSAFFDSDIAPDDSDPLELALNTDFLIEANLRMYLDNGAVDYVGPNQELFSSRLSARGIPHTYIINPVGDHDNTYWSSHVAEYLAFYARDWARDAAALPSCAS